MGTDRGLIVRLLLALLLCLAPLIAQENITIQFSAQGQWGGFDAYLVLLCNKSEVDSDFHSGLIRNAAAVQGLSPAGFSVIQRTLAKSKQMSAPRIVLSIAEAGGWVLSALVAGDAIWQPAAKWQRTLPVIGAGVIRLATTLTARHAPPEEKLPGDLLPTFVSVPGGGGCVEYTMLAVPQ